MRPGSPDKQEWSFASGSTAEATCIPQGARMAIVFPLIVVVTVLLAPGDVVTTDIRHDRLNPAS